MGLIFRINTTVRTIPTIPTIRTIRTIPAMKRPLPLVLLALALAAPSSRAAAVTPPDQPVLIDTSASAGSVVASSTSAVAYPASKAFDGKWSDMSADRWLAYINPNKHDYTGDATGESPAYVVYRFNDAAKVNMLRIRIPGDSNYAPTDRAPKAWTFLGSDDGTTWTTLDTRSGVTWASGDTVKTFSFENKRKYEYYKFSCTEIGGVNDYLQIYELQFLYDAGIVLTDLTTATSGRVSSASGTHGSYPATKAFDGNRADTNGRWLSSIGDHMYLVYRFNDATAVNAIRVWNGSDSAGGWNSTGRAPKAWTFSGSNDGETWTTLDTQASETGWAANGESRYYAFENDTPYEYYKYDCTALNGGTDYLQLWELEFFYVNTGSPALGIVSLSRTGAAAYSLSATEDANAADLAWIAGDGASATTNGWQSVAEGGTANWTVSGLAADTTYEISVLATNENGMAETVAGTVYTGTLSLGAATDDAIALYKFGYIDALEYNSPKVQGILRSELADFELPQRMLIGSDCHQWSVYPKHDSTTGASVAFCARIRALPSFKGLLMALTSPETRMGVAEALMQPSYCPSLSLCGHSVELSPGINVIIGENGSGKTSILDLMCPDIKPKDWVKRTGRALSFSCAKKPDHVTYIQQGDLQERYHKGTLFDSTLYLTPVHTSFELAVRAYASEIKKRIRQNISVADARETARSAVFLIDPSKEQQTHSFQATIPEGFSSLGNPWRKAPETLHGISSEIEAETKKGEVYSSDEIAKLQAAQRLIDEVRASVKRRKEERAVEIAARSVVLNALKKYKNAVQKRSSDEDIERNAYQESRTKFIDAVIGLARAESLTPITPIPSLLDADAGSTTNQRQGFNFVRTAAYVGSPDYGSGLLEKFRVGYRTLESLCAINSAEGAAKSIPSGKAATWETDFDSLVDKYIAEMEVCSDTIIDGNKVATGNTMGERAITYFKYVSLNMDGSSVLVVDQPEDNISNQRISGALLDYLNDLRIRGQVILATHNPLLVVNLDADNVIAIKEDSQGRKSVSFGCLESDEDGDVLQDIADIMDGGKEAIRKRMRAYGSVY